MKSLYRSIFVFFSFLPIFFLLSTPIQATSAGLNLINQVNSHSATPDLANVKNWMLYTPDSPSDLQNNPPSASNIVLRIHSVWTEIGKLMLGDSSQQDRAAQSWCQAINSFASTKSQVYVEPFNELSHPSECQSPSGPLDIDTAINRANSFISKFQSCLNSGITVTSPALDPQNANFPKTSQAFSRFSVISYHPYRSDTARNYSSGPLAGKQFIFTETGTLKNGQVIYDDCELIDFYCGEDITPFWQNQSDIIAYFLFTFAPGDYAGSWTLTNPSVVKALTAQCNEELPCLETPSCELESTYLPPVNVNDHLPATEPLPEPLNPLNKTPDYYPSAQDSQYVTVCQEINQTIKETANPGEDAEGNSTARRTVSSIAKEIKDLRDYHSNFYRWLTVYLKPITNPFADQEQLDTNFTSYDPVGYISTAYRVLSGDLQKEARNNLISQARSGQVLNEQIAWHCPNLSKPCRTLNCGKPDESCLPVYLTDVNHQCHQSAFNSLNFTTAGSANSTVIVKDDSGQEKRVERMRPNGAVTFDVGNQFANMAIPADEQTNSNIECKLVKRDQIEDSTNPITFNFFKNVIDNLINLFEPKTFTADVKLDQLDDPRLVEGTQTMSTFFSLFIPAKDQEDIDDMDKQAKGKVNIPDYGNEDLQNTFTNMLQPASWQEDSL